MKTILIVAICIIALLVLFPGADWAGVTTRISISSTGEQGNKNTKYPSVSADGRYVVFVSSASNLVSNDTNGFDDIFIRDLKTGVTELVSISSSDEQGNYDSSYSPSVSADGRYVAFWSGASNLVSSDTNKSCDIFIRDRKAGTTERVSVSSSGEPANDSSYDVSMSADGRYVAFRSFASNLVADDTNGFDDIFIRDRKTGVTERISVSTTGEQGDDGSFCPSLSADGRYVAFYSGASNLVSGDTNRDFDIFIRDRKTGTTERVSVSSSGEQSNYSSYYPSVSTDGRYVAFMSGASNLVSDDTDKYMDVFVRDRQSGTTERISVSTSGEQGDARNSSNGSDHPRISADGRYVAFHSGTSNLISGDTNKCCDIFIRDRMAGTTERISVSSSGEQANASSYDVSMSADGRYVAFCSFASNLISGDTNGFGDIFIHDRYPTRTPPANASYGSTPTK